jgi:putative peptidoglycan lipid II flippase
MPQNTTQLAKSAGLISVATMVSRVLGLIREQVIAHLFSRTATDAFYVAFRIPNLLRDLFAEGALSSAFVPTFTDYLTKKDRKEAWMLASTVTNILLVVISLITLVGILYSGRIAEKFAGNFRSVPGKFELTVQMTQMMFPFLPMVALAAIAMAMLNSHGRFFIPALAPALFNVGSLTGAVIFYSWLSRHGLDPIFGMAVGTLIGGLLQLLVQIPAIFKQGFKYSLKFNVKHSGMLRVFLLMGPGTLGLAATQINIFVNTWLATNQQEGAVSWLNYAFRLMHFPIGMFGVAIATATLPAISAHISRNEGEHLKTMLSGSLRMSFMVNIPASFGLIFLSTPIVALIYQHGRFNASDTNSTANALIFYAFGLFAYSAVKILVPAFYALGRSRIPVAISAVSVALNILLNLVLVRPLGYQGLALGTSLTSILNFVLLFYWLQKYTGRLRTRELAEAFLKVSIASLFMGVGSFYIHRWILFLFPKATILWRTVALLSSIVLGLMILFTSSKIMRIAECDLTINFVKRRFKSLQAL